MPEDVSVPSTLKGAAAQMWRSTFLSAYSGTCKDREDRDACAAKIAWGQVKTKYKKGEDGTWVAKAGDPAIGPVSQTVDTGGPPVLAGNVSIDPPQGLSGTRLERWKRAYLKALSGECRNKPKPVICARRVANRAVGLEEKAMTDEAHAVIERKDYDEETRKEFADKGWALSDGSYPIADCGDVRDAVNRIGTGKNNPRSKIVAHIRKRAKALGCEMTPALEEKMSYIERYLERKEERKRANEADRNIMIAMGDRPVVRPDHMASLKWRSLPDEQRTMRAEATRRIIERNYAQAVEDAQFLGWKVRVNHYDPIEYMFSKFVDTEAGELLVRSVLVRRPHELTWRMKPLSEFASGSLAADLGHGEIRHIKDANIVVPIIKAGVGSGAIERHYGPGPHPGTGTEQTVHGKGGGGAQMVDGGSGLKKDGSVVEAQPDATEAGRQGVKSDPGVKADEETFKVPAESAGDDYPEKLSKMTISQIASEIRRDWGSKVNFAAKPYLQAMGSLESVKDNYMFDSGYSVVAYFLSNAGHWRGEKARAVKAELKKRLKNV